MKSILHLKFIVLYIIFGFLCVFTTATLTNELIMDRLEEDISQSLYREATLISNNYLPSYFSEDSSIWAVQSQLIAMRLYLNSSLWFVAPDGSLITSSNIRGTTAPRTIENFDPAEIGNSQYITGTYHDYFDEDFITVMAPVTQGFSTKGYLLIHHPVSDIQKAVFASDASGLHYSGSDLRTVFHFPAGIPLLCLPPAAADHRGRQAVRHGEPGLCDPGSFS